MRTVVACAVLSLAVSAGCERPADPERAEPVVTESERPAPPAAAEDALDTVTVTDSLYMLVGRGGNIGVLVGDDSVLMIDDKFEPMAPAIKAAVAKLSGGKRIEYLINTHHHGDHTGGNPAFADATIVAHDNVRKRLVADGKPAAGYPSITFDGTTTLHFAGETVRIVHYPGGHTDGDSILFFARNNAVHTGDHFFHGRFPFVDLDSGGHPERLLANVTRLLDEVGPDTRIIPGHGDLASRADLEAYRTMLVTNIEHVKKQRAAGASLAAVKKKGVPAAYKGWGSGFVTDERWLEMLYTALR